ncbi:MAG TPA: glycosyltransferase family A protein [Gemmatimonadales bacterium]|jgi:glycosyltransferase involved in cell wall biosynthesis|nr:glycosyltransferase family A protein [Gemmatimonadales bacterium]
MSAPLVSCIIPVYNGERFLAEAITSILAQTHRPLEVIVVDDGSTDGTGAIVARDFAEHAGDAAAGAVVRYLRQENAGPVVARNTGVAAARGDYLAFLDADDTWVPKRLETQLESLSEHPEAAISVCLAQNFFMPGFEPTSDFERRHPKNQATPAFLSIGMVLSRAALDRVGPFDTSLDHGDGADWFLRARQLGVRDILVREVLVNRRIHGNNMSKTQAAASRDEFLAIIKRSLDQRRKVET